MDITWLIFIGFISLFATILLNKPIASQGLISELLKILISGYLGYLIRTVQQEENNDK